jgi:hypothetical protein
MNDRGISPSMEYIYRAVKEMLVGVRVPPEVISLVADKLYEIEQEDLDGREKYRVGPLMTVPLKGNTRKGRSGIMLHNECIELRKRLAEVEGKMGKADVVIPMHVLDAEPRRWMTDEEKRRATAHHEAARTAVTRRTEARKAKVFEVVTAIRQQRLKVAETSLEQFGLADKLRGA